MKQPKWNGPPSHQEGRYGRFKMINIRLLSNNRYIWVVSWSGSHRKIGVGETGDLESAKIESVIFLENFINKTFYI
jgi:hypothetical protein